VAVTVAWIKGEGYCFYLNDQIRNVNSSDHVESSDVFCFVIRSHYMASLNNLLPCWGTWSVRLMVPSSLPSSCRTDSALKFGAFFFFYVVRKTEFLLVDFLCI